jgi:hypothetical protein
MKQQIRLYLLTFLFFLFVGGVNGRGPAAAAESGATTTIILIRHAERDNFFILTDAGHKRAKALVEAVGDMGIKAIYSPNLERNLDTVRPLANHLGLDVTLTPRIQGAAIEQIVKNILARHAREAVLIVGNGSRHLRALHHRLGGTGEGPYRYGELFIYHIPDQGPVKVTKSRY